MFIAFILFAVLAGIGGAITRAVGRLARQDTAAEGAGTAQSGVDYAFGHAAMLWVTRSLAGLAALVFVIGSITVVSTKNVGIETTFGRTSGHLSNGLHLKWPWVNVTEMDAAIQTDSYTGGAALAVRIANQQTANVSISIRWRIRQAFADQLFQNYRTFDNVRDSLVTRELHAAVNQQFASYNPLDSIAVGTSSNGVSNASLNALAAAITAQMRAEIHGDGIEVLNTIIPIITFDTQTQARINQLQQQIALTRIAEQQLLTNQAQAQANQALAASVDMNTNVLVAQCLGILQDMVKNNQAVPAGFSCWPGGGLAGVIANSTK